MFIDIVDEKLKYFELDVYGLIGQLNSSLEFCQFVLTGKYIKVTEYEKFRIRRVVNKFEKYIKVFEEAQKIINMKNIEKYVRD